MELNVNAADLKANVSAINLASATAKVAEMSGSQASAPILGGANVRVAAGGGDLEKLLAQMQLEDEEKRLKMARERLASVLDLIEAMNAQQASAHSEAYTKIDQYAREMEEIEAAISAKEQEISRQDTTIQQAQRDVSSAQQVSDRAQHEMVTAQGFVDNAQAELDGLTQAPDESDADFAARQAQAQANLAQAQQVLANAQNTAAQASANLDVARTNLETALATKTQLETESVELQAQLASLSGKIDEQWGKLNDDELRALIEVMKLSAADVQTILNKESLEKDEDREAQMIQREAPAKTILKALDDYAKRLQESIDAQREAMI